MVIALRHPELVRRLCVVDIAPVDYGGSDEFAGYVEAMQGLDLGALERRADADAALDVGRAEPDRARLPAPEPAARGRRLALAGQPRGPRSRPRRAQRLAGRPPRAAGPVRRTGAVGCRRGLGYVRSEQEAEMRRLFPHTRKIVVKGAGHWVHAQRPRSSSRCCGADRAEAG